MLDRLDVYDKAFKLHPSKNTTCETIQISKGTVNTYQARQAEAARYGVQVGQRFTCSAHIFARLFLHECVLTPCFR